MRIIYLDTKSGIQGIRIVPLSRTDQLLTLKTIFAQTYSDYYKNVPNVRQHIKIIYFNVKACKL